LTTASGCESSPDENVPESAGDSMRVAAISEAKTRFSRQCFNTYAFPRAFLATADRLSRCNLLAWLDTPLYKHGAGGKVSDHVPAKMK
jgi:hypothetical protein